MGIESQQASGQKSDIIENEENEENNEAKNGENLGKEETGSMETSGVEVKEEDHEEEKNIGTEESSEQKSVFAPQGKQEEIKEIVEEKNLPVGIESNIEDNMEKEISDKEVNNETQ